MFCTVCKVPSTLKCKGCLGVCYCSKRCQHQDWPNHKKQCKKELYNVTHQPNLKIRMGKSKATKKETLQQERFQCEGCGTEDNLHIQRFKGYHKAVMCYTCRDTMNFEIEQIISQVSRVGVADDETLVLTETDEGVEISKVKTKFADLLDLEH